MKSETIVEMSERNCDQQMIKIIGITDVRTLKQSNIGNTFIRNDIEALGVFVFPNKIFDIIRVIL